MALSGTTKPIVPPWHREICVTSLQPTPHWSRSPGVGDVSPPSAHNPSQGLHRPAVDRRQYMLTTHRIGAIALLALAITAGPAQAQNHAGSWHHHHDHAHWRFGFGI